MQALHIITPVKDSIDLTLETIQSILKSELSVPLKLTIYNDYSSEETTQRLAQAAEEFGFELLNLSDLTPTPSPNYLFVLRYAQQRALAAHAGLMIVESDVIVKKDTIEKLYQGALERPDCGIAASVTVDEKGAINYPYLYAVGKENQVYACTKHVSFCCSLLTLNLLKTYDLMQLNPEKNWFDVTISHESIKLGFKNYLFTNLPVWHRPHGSRPWKQLKYTNPLKYYWLKLTKGLDKI